MYSNQSNTVLSSGDVEISRVGYQLWRDAGRPAGRYMEFWNKAKQVLVATQTAARSPKSAHFGFAAPHHP